MISETNGEREREIESEKQALEPKTKQRRKEMKR